MNVNTTKSITQEVYKFKTMKEDVKRILKDRSKIYLFTEERYEKVKHAMMFGVSKDKWLKCNLSLDPLNKASWIADHLIFLSERNHI